MDLKKATELVIKAQSGDKKALNDLFSECYGDLYYFALKTVKNEDSAADVVQDSAIDIMNTICELKNPKAFLQWSRMIVYRKCTKYFKPSKEIQVKENEDGETVFDNLADEDPASLPENVLENKELRKAIASILETLPPEQRAAMTLYYYDGLSVSQIAEIQGVSQGTVKSRLNYARKAVKEKVEEYEEKTGTKLHAAFIPFFLKDLFKREGSAVSRAATPKLGAPVGKTSTTSTVNAVSDSAVSRAATPKLGTPVGKTSTTSTVNAVSDSAKKSESLITKINKIRKGLTMKSKIIIIASTVLAVLAVIGIIVGVTACGNDNAPADPVTADTADGEHTDPAAANSDTGAETQSMPEEGDIVSELLSYFSPAPHVGETVAEYMERNPLLKSAEKDGDEYLIKADDLFASKNYKVTKYTVSHQQRTFTDRYKDEYKFDDIIAPYKYENSQFSDFYAVITIETEDSSTNSEFVEAIKAYYEKDHEIFEDPATINHGYSFSIKCSGELRPILESSRTKNSFDLYNYYEFGSETWNESNDVLVFKNKTISEMANEIKDIFSSPVPKENESIEDYVSRWNRNINKEVFKRKWPLASQAESLVKWIAEYDCKFGVNALMNGDVVLTGSAEPYVLAFVSDYNEAVELFDIMTEFYTQKYTADKLQIARNESSTAWTVDYVNGGSRRGCMKMTQIKPTSPANSDYNAKPVYQFELFYYPN